MTRAEDTQTTGWLRSFAGNQLSYDATVFGEQFPIGFILVGLERHGFGGENGKTEFAAIVMLVPAMTKRMILIEDHGKRPTEERESRNSDRDDSENLAGFG